MYDIKLINPLVQFGYTHWTLTFEDATQQFPAIRLDKKYADKTPTANIIASVRATIESWCQLETTPPPIFDDEGNFLHQDAGTFPDLAGSTIQVFYAGGEIDLWQI